MSKQRVSLFWFRRDLRLDDNRGLFEALSGEHPVIPLFIFDTTILDTLPRDDHRVTLIFNTLQFLRKELKEKYNSSIDIRLGKPKDIWVNLIKEYRIGKLYTNRDYEPYARERDKQIERLLTEHDIDFLTFKDQVIFERDEVIKDDNTPYVVYTPYKNKWNELFNSEKDLNHYDIHAYAHNFYSSTRLPQLSLDDIGFVRSEIEVFKYDVTPELIENYTETRNYPSKNGTSHLGPYLRFGMISIRRVMKIACSVPESTFMNELIWREFFMQIMWHFPHTKNQAFKEKYDAIPWRDAPEDLEKWKKGKTGYPLVDAGMRELNATGYMHNRVRMVVASFLCKHLLINWREGERYFAEKLFDYELSSNVGNWQWVAGSGVDAAPYFRIFNPETQFKKFDPNGEYVRKWVPEYFGVGYVSPMIDHREARKRVIETYKTALDNYSK